MSLFRYLVASIFQSEIHRLSDLPYVYHNSDSAPASGRCRSENDLDAEAARARNKFVQNLQSVQASKVRVLVVIDTVWIAAAIKQLVEFREHEYSIISEPPQILIQRRLIDIESKVRAVRSWTSPYQTNLRRLNEPAGYSSQQSDYRWYVSSLRHAGNRQR